MCPLDPLRAARFDREVRINESWQGASASALIAMGVVIHSSLVDRSIGSAEFVTLKEAGAGHGP
jgi:hypothetical protein